MLLVWAILLFLQAAAGTWLSRARNGKSLRFHLLASFVSYIVWFVSQVVMVDQLVFALKSENLYRIILMGFIFTGASTFGGVLTHHLLQEWSKET